MQASKDILDGLGTQPFHQLLMIQPLDRGSLQIHQRDFTQNGDYVHPQRHYI